MARELLALMPPRRSGRKPGGWFHYVEPYFGGGSLLLANDPAGISEVVNDLDGALTNFWRILACPVQFTNFRRRVMATPFSEGHFRDAVNILAADSGADDVARAVAFFVLARQSMGGQMRSFAPPAKRIRSGMNDGVSHWLNTIERLPQIHARLRRVLILDARPALEVIRSQDGPGTLFYLDPPYLHETRQSTDVYAHEMTLADHGNLLDVLAEIKGRFMLSGYRSKLYAIYERNAGWKRRDFDKPNHAAGGKKKRRMVESVWMNY